MPLSNITDASTQYIGHSIRDNWVVSRETNFLKKHVLARGAYCLLTPASFISTAIDTIVGIGVGVGAILSLGIHKPTYELAYKHSRMSNQLFSLPYQNFLRTINPEAKFLNTQGFLVSSLIQPLIDIGRSCKKSNNFLTRHIASRLTFALTALACIVTRAVDGVIGIPLAAFSILTVGKFQFINDLAYKAFKLPGIVNDVFLLTMAFINPFDY